MESKRVFYADLKEGDHILIKNASAKVVGIVGDLSRRGYITLLDVITFVGGSISKRKSMEILNYMFNSRDPRLISPTTYMYINHLYECHQKLRARSKIMFDNLFGK